MESDEFLDCNIVDVQVGASMDVEVMRGSIDHTVKTE